MLDSQKLVGSGPVKPVRRLSLWSRENRWFDMCFIEYLEKRISTSGDSALSLSLSLSLSFSLSLSEQMSVLWSLLWRSGVGCEACYSTDVILLWGSYYKYKHHCDWVYLDCRGNAPYACRHVQRYWIGRFISRRSRVPDEAGSRRRVSVAGSNGPAFCRYREGKLVDNIHTILMWRRLRMWGILYGYDTVYTNVRQTIIPTTLPYYLSSMTSIWLDTKIFLKKNAPDKHLSNWQIRPTLCSDCSVSNSVFSVFHDCLPAARPYPLSTNHHC